MPQIRTIKPPAPPPPQPAAAKPKPPEPPREFQEGDIAKMDAAGLIRIVSDAGASEFQKAKACQRIGELGAKEAVPTLANLLGDERMAMYARYGLEPIADPSVDDALRAALAKLSGNLRIGVINSIAKRRDPKAGPALVKLMHGEDLETARAAAAALGAIGNPEAAKELLAALGKTRGTLRMTVGDAALVCAERMIASGRREQGLALYASLSGTEVPKAVRLGAMAAVIREETSVSRPR